jgi:hypothetical protein
MEGATINELLQPPLEMETREQWEERSDWGMQVGSADGGWRAFAERERARERESEGAREREREWERERECCYFPLQGSSPVPRGSALHSPHACG